MCVFFCRFCFSIVFQLNKLTGVTWVAWAANMSSPDLYFIASFHSYFQLFLLLLKLKTCVICNVKKRTFNKCVNFIYSVFFSLLFMLLLHLSVECEEHWFFSDTYNLFNERRFSRSPKKCLFSTHKYAFYVDTTSRNARNGWIITIVCLLFLRSLDFVFRTEQNSNYSSEKRWHMSNVYTF